MAIPPGGYGPRELANIFAGIAAFGLEGGIPSYSELRGVVGKRGLTLDGKVIEPLREYLYVALWANNLSQDQVFREPYDSLGYYRQEYWPIPNMFGQFTNANMLEWLPRVYWGRLMYLSIHRGVDGPMLAYQRLGRDGIDAFSNTVIDIAPGRLTIDERFLTGDFHP